MAVFAHQAKLPLHQYWGHDLRIEVESRRLHQRSARCREEKTLHPKPAAVDIVNASREQQNLTDPGLTSPIASPNLMLGCGNKPEWLFVFAACSYQTWNSRTIVYATSSISNPYCLEDYR